MAKHRRMREGAQKNKAVLLHGNAAMRIPGKLWRRMGE
jgi:hypothetical protein